MLQIVNGDLLESKCTIIAHQCNCKTQSAAGLSATIFAKFPYADVYSSRTTPSIPGTVEICGNGREERYVANMFAQRYPSVSKWKNDTSEMRQQWFRSCLDLIADFVMNSGLKNVSVGFPYLIGCGLAGGKWDEYEGMLREWSKTAPCDVMIFKRHFDEATQRRL